MPIRWHRSSDAAHVDSGDRVVALDLTANDPRPQALEGVAAVIWRLLEEPQTEDELVESLSQTYDGAPRDQIAADLAAFLRQLAAANLATTTAPDDL